MSPPKSKPASSQGSAPLSRRRTLRNVVWTAVSLIALAAGAAAFLYYWTGSASFENWARGRLIAEVQQATGGRVEMRAFHWHPLELDAQAEGLVIHGSESAGEAPYAQVDKVHAKFSILEFLSPRILLRDLEITRPSLHLIVYPDGSTNEPHPRETPAKGKSTLDTIFDLQAGRIAMEQGVIDFEDRAATFDFLNRYTLADLSAKDISLRMSYASAAKNAPEKYRIEAGARDIAVVRGTGAKTVQAKGYAQATLDLMRNAMYVRSLRLTSQVRDEKGRAQEHALEVTGSLEDFTRPHWQARILGELDMHVLDAATGYPFSPDGLARLDLSGSGLEGQFRLDGSVHVDNGDYIGPGVNARGIVVDAHMHADPEQLLITQIVARLQQGGRMEGTVALSHWLPPVPGAPAFERAGQSAVRATPGSVPRTRIVHPPPVFIPVDGKVRAEFKDVPLTAVLEIVGQPPLQQLGFDTLLNGPATATWIKGDQGTLNVGATLGMTARTPGETDELPASGALDATYTQKNGAVDLRKLELHTPGGELDAHGLLGAYPVTSATDLAVEFHSHDLRDYDTILRDLGLKRDGKTGTAALPVTLKGQADFRGTWTGSLTDPRLAGAGQATDIAIETAPQPGDPSGKPQWVHWDAVQASGSYSAARINIDHGDLKRGATEIVLDGSLVAAAAPPSSTGNATVPEFNDDSTLRMHVHGSKVGVEQLLPLTGRPLPLKGAFDTQLELNGQIRALSGSGWVELDNGTLYGQPIARIRAQGTLANQLVKLSSVTVNAAGGTLEAKGQFNFESQQFELDSHANDIDMARIDSLGQRGLNATGKLSLTAGGTGTVAEPHLDMRGTFAGLAVNGEDLGPLAVTAHLAGRVATYDASTRVESAGLTLHGQTALSGDYETQAKLDFSDFNIAALLVMAHLEALGGTSALAGTMTLDGPLAKPAELRGEARLNDLAVTISGVHLKSDGSLHASLVDARVTLDPLHITGEETDLHMQGTVGLTGEHRLDFAANGGINFKLGQMLDPDLTSSGTATFQVEAHGPWRDPGLRGRIDFENGSLSLEDVPNGLSQIHGTLEFNQDRLEVKSLTAMSGGGLLSVTGYLAYQHGLYADLSVAGKAIRIRYPSGVSSLADANLHLQGLENNLLLSGNVLITRFSVSPDFDFAGLAAQANLVQAVAPPEAPSNHVRLDVRITSSPQLNFQNTVAKLAGNVDLRLRGTIASPTLLGTIQITEGTALLAGTRYELQRGTISFTNPVRIEPSIDLSASAHVTDYDITLGLHGTPSKLSITYRSDPPLPEQDVVALLALGRTENQQRLYTQQQEQETASQSTDVLLGGALNATVSSRVQKLFGAGSVKVDPNYIGALGNSTTRIIVEEQLGRNVTLTYATNVDTTQQQLIQAEIAINRHISLLVARDESDVFSMVIKATRRYR
jgi:translocation and assembly module TamB